MKHSTGTPFETACCFILLDIRDNFWVLSLCLTQHTVILPDWTLKNGAKRIFEILWGIPEGRTNSARPSRSCLKNGQNGTFWSVHGIWKFFGPNDIIWDAMKVPFSDFIQNISQAPSSSVQVLIWEDKLDYLKNPSQDFKNYFCIWCR